MVKKLFLIVGETASGKDSVVKRLEADGLGKAVVSFATRPMREGEENGREHWFVSQTEFNKIMEGSVLAYTKIAQPNGEGYEYCATLETLGDSNIYVIDPNGVSYMKKAFPNLKTCVIYIYASLEERLQRAQSRSDFDTAFRKRVEAEAEQFADFRYNKAYDYLVYNEGRDFEEVYEDVKNIFIYEEVYN